MQVFKVSMKILKRNYPSILIYVVIFLGLSLLFAVQSNQQEEEYSSFDTVKTNVAIFQEEDTPLVRGFIENLKETSNIVEVEDKPDIISDALYFRMVTYVIRIPEGFTESFMNGEEVRLMKQTIPDNITNIYTELSVDSYFNTARSYLSVQNDLTEEELVEKTAAALSKETPVDVKSYGMPEGESYSKFYFNYLSYSMVSILVLGTSIIMLVWKDLDLFRRTEVSPLTRQSINLQKYLALGVFTLFTWAVLSFAFFLVNRGAALDQKMMLHLLNSLVFAFTAMGMSFLVGTFLKSRNAISAVSNVIALGPSFISGVFVPQEFLGDNVLTLAKVTPTYWYVTANNIISSLSGFSGDPLNTIYQYMIIVGAFGLFFFAAPRHSGAFPS